MPPTIIVITAATALCVAYMLRSLVRNPSNHALRSACLSTVALWLAVSCGMAFTGDQPGSLAAVVDLGDALDRLRSQQVAP